MVALLESQLLALPLLSEAEATMQVKTAIDLHRLNPVGHKKPRLVLNRDPGPGMMLEVWVNPAFPPDYMVLCIGNRPIGRILMDQTQETTDGTVA